ncbi:GNAT family N-acetyltransferase [Saccharothrix violaceirubra]
MLIPRIQAALRASIVDDSVRVGPFLVRFDAGSDHPFLNYAVPDDGADPTSEQVAELVAAFRARSRTPRLEYLRPAPAADAALAAAGFTVDQLLPMMAIDALTAPPTPAGVALALATSDADLFDVATVQNVGFGVDAPATDSDVARQRAVLDAGGFAVVARLGDAVVGAGVATAPHDGLSQVAGIAVPEAFRRRGIASTVCADLTARVFAAGWTPFLETEPDGKVTRLYGPLGFYKIGESAAVTLK